MVSKIRRYFNITKTLSDFLGTLEWTEGPRMARERYNGMCGTLEKGNSRFVVTIGGYPPKMENQCEYLEIFSNRTLGSWKNCSNIPTLLSYGQLLTEPESGDLILLGGKDPYSETAEQDSIYRLSNIQSEWILEPKRLKARRYAHVSLFVANNSGGHQVNSDSKDKLRKSEL